MLMFLKNYLYFPYRSAILTYMGDYIDEEYSVRISRDRTTGVMVSQSWHNQSGALHRSHGLPAYVAYDPTTSRPVEIQYWLQGQEHREDGLPSSQKISPETGVVWYERWWVHGMPAEGRPAAIERDPRTGDVTLIMRYRASDGQWIIDYKKPSSNAPSMRR